MKTFIKILISSSFLFLLFTSYADLSGIQEDTKNGMILSEIKDSGIIKDDKTEGTNGIDSIAAYITKTIFSILSIIAVGAFIFMGIKLVTAQGKPDEFKKTMIWFVYTIIGLAIIPLSFTIIKFISSINL